MRKKIVLPILILVFLFTATFAWIQIIREYRESKESADVYTDFDKYVDIPEIPVEKETNQTDPSESGEMQAPNSDPTIDFDALLSINPDCVGWIYIPDTGISYPVVQGSDNSHYLKHLFDGKWNSGGSIFLICVGGSLKNNVIIKSSPSFRIKSRQSSE